MVEPKLDPMNIRSYRLMTARLRLLVVELVREDFQAERNRYGTGEGRPIGCFEAVPTHDIGASL